MPFRNKKKKGNGNITSHLPSSVLCSPIFPLVVNIGILKSSIVHKYKKKKKDERNRS